MVTTTCHGCGERLRLDGPVGRRATCPSCDADLHTCLNCRHYEEGAPHACREPQADHVVDKDAVNACDLFQLGDGASRQGGPPPPSSGEVGRASPRRVKSRAALDALGALFGDAPAKDEDPRDALEKLFRS